MIDLPSYENLKSAFPLKESQKAFIEQSRDTVRQILEGKDRRLLLIIGPCSIHDPLSAIEYAHCLKAIQQELSSHFFIVMRVYCEKARSSFGWKGFLYDPCLDGSHQMELGLRSTRTLLLNLIDLGVPAGTEFLDPVTAPYYEELISWGSIGARTSSSQPHRQFASGLNLPIGFKNDIGGNISVAVQGAMAASQPQSYLAFGHGARPVLIRTSGNRDSHIVLRGGEVQPNYDPSSIQQAIDHLKEAVLPLRVLIDCSHQNSRKLAQRQIEVFQSVLQQFKAGNQLIRGLMVESFLNGGCQPFNESAAALQYGVSITDPCLDWPSTSTLLRWGAEYLDREEEYAEAERESVKSIFQWNPVEALISS